MMASANRMKLAVIAAVTVSMVLALGACSSGPNAAAASAVKGGDLKIAMTASNIPLPSTPPDQGYEGNRFVGNNIYDGLTKLNLDQTKTLPTPQPALATSWESSPDLTTWTFHLRKGVTFQDGTPFNADAVIFELDREHNPKFKYYDQVTAARSAATLRYFKSYEKIDDDTVVIHTTQPYAWLPWDLASTYFPSPTVVKKYGNANYNQHAIGTGPFTMTKYIDGQVMVLSRNEHYWAGPPKLNSITLYPEPEASSRLAMLESHQVNWAEAPSPDSIDELKADGFTVELGQYPHAIAPRFNLFRAPFKNNLALRQALNYALDRKGTEALINNAGYPAPQYVYDGNPAYVADDPGYSYNLKKAKALLAKSGYKPGELTLTMAYPTGGSGNMYPDTMMQKMQADFKAIGVNLTLDPLEWDTILTIGLEGLNASQWKNIDILWASPAAGMMPTGYSSTFLSKSPAGNPNATGLNDPDIDKDLTAASQAPTTAVQYADIQKMMRVATDKAYFLFWMHDLNLRVLAPEVKGYVKAKSWWVDFTRISVDK